MWLNQFFIINTSSDTEFQEKGAQCDRKIPIIPLRLSPEIVRNAFKLVSLR